MAVNELTKGLDYLGNRANAFYEKNKAHIFTGLGIGGTIATGILAAQSGARAARKIDRKQEELGRKLSFIEKGKLCWTDAIAPIAVGGLACYSEFKSDRISSKIIADRTMMLIGSEKAYEKLSQKTKEVLGEKKAKQVQDEIAKEKVQQATQMNILSDDAFENAPKVGNGPLYRFVDGYTLLPFWSNADYIELQVSKLREMMRDTAPRNKEEDYYDKPVGVFYREWLSMIGYSGLKNISDSPERRTHGWNKGFARDGSDDDEIDYSLTSIQWKPGVAVSCINWETNPTDMRLGRLIKSSGIM